MLASSHLRAGCTGGRGLRLLTVTMVAAGLLAAGCTTGSGDGRAPAAPAASPAAKAGGTDQCHPGTICYTPAQLQVAYGVKPLLDHGIDGRGETVVLPELAETQPDPPLVTDLRQDMTSFDRLFHLPAARMRVTTALAGASSPWLALGEEVLDVEVVHALAPDAPPSTFCCSRQHPWTTLRTR